MSLVFAPKNHSEQRKMNLSASCPLHMQIISDQLMNGAIFHSCETVITKGIETQNRLRKDHLANLTGSQEHRGSNLLLLFIKERL